MTNEAAARLLEAVGHEARMGTTVSLLVHEALAAERRATVERIEKGLLHDRNLLDEDQKAVVKRVLDEEAARV